MERRSAARLLAVQAVYQMALTETAAEKVLAEFVDHRIGPPRSTEDGRTAADRALFAELVQGVAEARRELDDMIAGALGEDWTLERLEILLRAMLTCGAYELGSHLDIPARVTITEYVNIAHAYYGGKVPAMVNAVLDRVGRVLRPEDLKDPGHGQPAEAG